MFRKVLDFFAALCLCFDVDWDTDFEDDDYVIAYREAEKNRKENRNG